MPMGRIFAETFTALFPVYVYMLLGVFLRKIGLLHASANLQINRLVMSVFLPTSLFLSICNAELVWQDNLGAIGFTVASLLLLFAVIMIAVPRIVRDRAAAGSIAQALYRSNFATMGLVYTGLLYGEAGAASVSILIAVIVPMFNVLAIVGFESLRGGKVHWTEILPQILKNPLVIAPLLGVALRLFGLQLPPMMEKPLAGLAGVTAPLVQIVIGASLSAEGFRRNGSRVLAATAGKLAIVPLVVMPFAILFGFRDAVLVALLAAFAGPTAAICAPVAESLGGDGELAGQITAASTLVSLGTMFLFLVALRALGFC